MKIAGLQKLTLIDFPGHVAATVFTQGCPFRCGFCHNPELVIPEKFEGLVSEKVLFDFLESRYGKLTGICLTGGEPLMQPDADRFISHMKALGFDVKLDTNGYYPDRLKKIIADGDVDYIAMDVKSPLDRYQLVTKARGESLEAKVIPKSPLLPEEGQGVVGEEGLGVVNTGLERRIMQSIKLIMNSGIDYEFRTTVAKPIHAVEDFEEIGKMVRGAKRYYIQNFVKSKHIDDAIKFEPFSDTALKKAKTIIKKYVKEVEIR